MLEKGINKWWFYLVVLIAAFVPSVTQKPLPPEQISLLIQEVLQNPLAYSAPVVFPVTKILILIMVTGILLFKNIFRKVFALFFIFLLTGIALFQNISMETQFGTAFLLGNFIIQSIVVLSWVHELLKQENNYKTIQLSWWKITCLILGFFAFWMPARNGFMNFSAADIMLNEAGLTYCMITPFLLAFLFLYFPAINRVTLRVTSYGGLIFGILNMMTWFVLNTEYWWMGVIHLPLMIISIIGMIISTEKQMAKAASNNG